MAPGHPVLAFPRAVDLLSMGGLLCRQRQRGLVGIRARISPVGPILRPRVVRRLGRLDRRLRRRTDARHRGHSEQLRHRGFRRGARGRHRVLGLDHPRVPPGTPEPNGGWPCPLDGWATTPSGTRTPDATRQSPPPIPLRCPANTPPTTTASPWGGRLPDP